MKKDNSDKLYLILFLLFGILLIAWNQVIELRAEEPRRAVVAMEMVLSGDYLIPKLNGWIYINKPPLYSWILVFFFKVFQSFDEWLVRLPGILSLMLTTLFLFKIHKRNISVRTAWIPVFLLICSVDLLFYGSVNGGEIDLFYMLLVTLQVLSIFHFSESNKVLSIFIASYVVCALGFLTKGPPSLVFQALTLAAWLIYIKKWKLLLSWQHALGIVVFFSITGLYFFLYDRSEYSAGDYLIRLLKESSQRTAAESSFLDLIKQSVVFPFRLLALLFPGSLFIYLLWRKNLGSLIKQNKLIAFCLLFILINIPLYWFTGEFKARYLYPLFPFFCLIFSWSLTMQDKLNQKRKRQLEKLMRLIIIFCLLGIWSVKFFDFAHQIEFLDIQLVGISLLLIALLYAFRKFEKYRLHLFFILFAILRLGFNLMYLPAVQNDTNFLKYRTITKEIISHTGQESVHFYNKAFEIESDIRIGSKRLLSAKHKTAAPLAYQVPYYLMKNNKKILLFEEDLVPGQFYLAPKRLVENLDVEIYYEYIEGWYNWSIVLFKLN